MAELESGELKVGLQIDYAKLHEALEKVKQKHAEFIESLHELENTPISYVAEEIAEKTWWKFWKRK